MLLTTAPWGILIFISLGMQEAVTAGGHNDLGADLGKGQLVRAWLDLSFSLPTGILHQVEALVGAFKLKTPVLHIHLWSPAEQREDAELYTLKWQKSVLLNKGGNRLYQIHPDASQTVAVEKGDMIGWSCDSDAVSISSTFDESYGSLFYTFKSGEVFQLGRNYTFDGLVHPQSFSIRAIVKETAVGLENGITDILT